MSGMIERVARAAYEKFIEDVRDLEPSWDELPQSHRDRMMASQRAAMESMREPTEQMCGANIGNCDFAEGQAWLREDARETWELMIDAALSEDGE